MGSIGRYILRTTIGAFFLVLASLTAIIWVSYALRDIDLMTSQGQTILTFIEITSLVVPQLVLVIAPVAFVIAVASCGLTAASPRTCAAPASMSSCQRKVAVRDAKCPPWPRGPRPAGC